MLAANARMTSPNLREILDCCICDVITLRIHGRKVVFPDTSLRELSDCILLNNYKAGIREIARDSNPFTYTTLSWNDVYCDIIGANHYRGLVCYAKLVK